MLQNLLNLSRRIWQQSDSLRNRLIDLIPTTCLLCGLENDLLICAECRQQFFCSSTNRCVRCALPLLSQDARCGSCLAHPPAFDHTIVACDYVAPLDQLVRALKFEHQLIVANALADALAQAALRSERDDLERPDLFIPVPLGRSRLIERGFNQAYEIAKPFARRMQRPLYAQLLLRVRETTAQTLLHPNQRHDNIRHAFCPGGDKDKIAGSHIGVIDDVMTTGATLHEIAACLKRHGALSVSNYVFARTPPH